MKKLLLPVLIVLFFNGGLHAQRGRGLVDKSDESTNYITFSIGPGYCLADTWGPVLEESPLENYDISIGFRKIYASNFGYKLAVNYSNFTGDDDYKGSTHNRFFKFNSQVTQLSLQGEYHIKIGRAYYYKTTPNSIYGFVGIGYLYSNANLKQDTIPRGGDYKFNKNYPAVVFPFGIGYQYNIKEKFLIGAEFNGRYPLSDFIDGFSPIILDDVTKKVNPNNGSHNNDFMGGFSITLTWLLGFEYLRRN